jgi:N-carbamoyl-L-amino-acid hydrolase
LTLNPSRAVSELRELQALTGDSHGAQREAWSPGWEAARDWLKEKLAALAVSVEVDEAANLWATLEGESSSAVIVGSHLDSVPNGGWLDGALGVVAALEVLRHTIARGSPAATIRLVDFADEEGTRFGRSLFGSSCVSGTICLADLRGLRDRAGLALPDVLTSYGIRLEQALESHRQLSSAAAFVELHVEQGPTLERLGLPLGVVIGTYHIERHAVHFTGRVAHESWPMEMRRDALAAAARLTIEVREIARQAGGYGTVGSIVPRPGLVTAVAGECQLTVDLRHREDAVALEMVQAAREASAVITDEEGVLVRWSSLWEMPAVSFDPNLIELATEAVEEVASTTYELPSGPLHDAAEMARAGIPSVMLFVQSIDGVSHAREEDTSDDHLQLSVRALAVLVEKMTTWAALR